MSDCADVLTYHNEWRRGAARPMLPPARLGQAIDEAVAELQRLRAIEAAARHLIEMKGRFNTELAYRHLAEALRA